MRLTAQQRRVLASLAAVLVLLALWWVERGGSTEPESRDSARDTSQTSSTSPSTDSGTDPESGLPWIEESELPDEAIETLQLIDDGGPFPYDRDGITFENREEILPDQQQGYYHEYTVPTPGSGDRGAKRIVTGSSDEFFWTADHYSSFSRIAR